MLVPIISVIDEDDNYYSAEDDWSRFRAKYPYRPFCLLIPKGWWGNVTIPSEAQSDPKFQTHAIGREDLTLDDWFYWGDYDGDDDSNITTDSWFELCGLDKLSATTVRSVGLSVDQSGSMTKTTVEESYNQFIQDAAAAKLTICEVVGGYEDWITPFDTSLTVEGGQCTQAELYESTNRPTWSPTVTRQPSTDWPTWSPTSTPTIDDTGGYSPKSLKKNICLRKSDPYRTCFQRSVNPSNNLTKGTILREEYNKGALNECGKYTPSWNESFIEPYTAPYVAEDEVLTNGTVYLSMLMGHKFRNVFFEELKFNCDDFVELEEVLLEWLYVSCVCACVFCLMADASNS
jgi:hypothetical protein